MPSKDYEYLEHTADLFFRSYGKSPGECYGNAAKALFSAMIDLGSVSPLLRKTVRLESGDLPALMHDWLSELLFLFGTEGLVFRDFDVEIRESAGKYGLFASLAGERFDRKKHVILADVKAVTYHGLKVEERDGVWVAEVLCDI